MMLEQRKKLIALLLPKETSAKAMQRLRPKPRQSLAKKKNIRKSELERLKLEE